MVSKMHLFEVVKQYSILISEYLLNGVSMYKDLLPISLEESDSEASDIG